MLDISSQNAAVRTVLHLSPSVLAIAVVQSQRTGMGLKNWLDKVVVSACAEEQALDASPGSLTDDNTIELFASVVDSNPELLRGPWLLLYQNLLLQPDMFRVPRFSDSEIETAADYTPEINRVLLRIRWAGLVAKIFGL